MRNFIAMKWTRPRIFLIILLLLCLILKWYSSDADRVERMYSSGFFPAFAGSLRKGFGWMSLSVGDFLYGIAAAWLLFKCIKVGYYLFKRNTSQLRLKLIRNVYSMVVLGCIIYLVFNLFWGINYNRKGIAWQLGLEELTYTTNDLKLVNERLVHKVNQGKTALINGKTPYPSNKLLFQKAAEGYARLSQAYPFLQYQPSSLKQSIWGWFGNYAGFTGYYNPFTGEAQVNTTVPQFLLPFTTSHEVAHQLGYAKEMEANFVGYLAATHSSDTLFHYSAYLELFLYANRNLNMVDSSAAAQYRHRLLQPVRDDIKEWFAFNKKHRGALEPVVRWVYGKFLESNEQPQGILSYDEVTGFLIAYSKKYGRL